jgi:hypothetical protein
MTELAYRQMDGLEVTLLWDSGSGCVAVEVEDTRSGEHFAFAVAGEQALDAFNHPYAYAAQAPRVLAAA